MDKFNGLKLTSFLTGVVVPVFVCCYLVSAMLKKGPEIIVPTEETVKLAESNVSVFSVDYEMYGKYTLGSDKVITEICNNSSNVNECSVWLEGEDGRVISEVWKLRPSERCIVLNTTERYGTAGEYVVKLIYEVYTDEHKSRIECPYVILANGGI